MSTTTKTNGEIMIEMAEAYELGFEQVGSQRQEDGEREKAALLADLAYVWAEFRMLAERGDFDQDNVLGNDLDTSRAKR